MRLFILLIIFLQLLVAPTLLSAIGIEYDMQITEISDEESNQTSPSQEQISDDLIHHTASHKLIFWYDFNSLFITYFLSYDKEIYISVQIPPPELV